MRFSVLRTYHRGCWASEVSDELTDVKLFYHNAGFLQLPSEKITFAICELIGKSKGDVEKFYRKVQKHPTVKNTSLLYKSERAPIVKFQIHFSEPRSVTECIYESKCLFIEPLITFNSYETFGVLSEGKKTVFELNSLLKEIGDPRIVSDKEISPMIVDVLTDPRMSFDILQNISSSNFKKDVDILKFAKKMGYYDWPRKTSMDEMAKKLELKRSTLQYKLRTAEKTIFPLGIDVYSAIAKELYSDIDKNNK